MSTENSPAGRGLKGDPAWVDCLVTLCFYIRKILHRITPGRPRRQPERGGEGPAGEDRAIAGAVAERELLPGAREEHGVLSGKVSRAHAGDVDLPRRHAPAGSRCGTQAERGPGWGVALAAVVHLEDVDVEVAGERAGARPHELHEHGNRDARVRRDEHGDLARRGGERRFEPALEPRGADEQRLVRRPTGREIGARRGGGAEVDRDVRLGERAWQVAADDEIARAESCELAR